MVRATEADSSLPGAGAAAVVDANLEEERFVFAGPNFDPVALPQENIYMSSDYRREHSIMF